MPDKSSSYRYMYMNYKKNYNFTYLIIKLNKNEFYKNIFKYRQYFFFKNETKRYYNFKFIFF